MGPSTANKTYSNGLHADTRQVINLDRIGTDDEVQHALDAYRAAANVNCKRGCYGRGHVGMIENMLGVQVPWPCVCTQATVKTVYESRTKGK